jgi:hypothetical protein
MLPAPEEKTTKRRPLPPSPDYVTMREVAIYCCVSEAAVSRGTRSGAWPFKFLRRVEIGGRVIFTRASFCHMCRMMKRSADSVPEPPGR